jgi:hypothetical protein
MKHIAEALIIIALLVLAVILILNNHPVWGGLFVILTGTVRTVKP